MAIGAAPAGVQLVEALLTRRGYDVARYPSDHPLLAGAWAALFPEMELAACDGALSRQRQAFALAHELGHLVLHETTTHEHEAGDSAACGAEEIDAGADPQDALRGALEVYNPRQQRELEANVFALNLLLPRPLIRRLFLEEGLDARALAERLDVSHTAALQALAGLLQPQPEAIIDLEGAGRERPLDESQQAAATSTHSPVLVQAGPGTGKTGTLVGRVRYLVAERGIAPDKVLVLTFANRAVGELRGRLLGALGAHAQSLQVSTFHSFAHELLRRYSAAAGLPPDFRVLDRPALLVLLRARLAEEAPPELVNWISLERPTAALAGLIEVAGRLKEDLIDVATFERRLREHARTREQPSAEEAQRALLEEEERGARQVAFYAWYQRSLDGAGVLDYADLIMRVVRLLRAQPAIRAEIQGRYPQVLVDEYQDINRASATLLLELCREGTAPSTLWAVGDPRQSIYRWRGAAPEVLRSLEPAGGPATGARTGAYAAPAMPALHVNYRSYGPIVRLCGGVAAALDGLPVEDGRAQWQSARGEHLGPCITLALAPDGASELAGIAREIRCTMAAGYDAADHAVLCATHAQADAVAAVLRAHGVPVCRPSEPADDPAVREALSILGLALGDGEALVRVRHAALTPAGALLLIEEARTRGEGILATLAHPPAALAPEQQAASRALATFLWSLPVTRTARNSGLDGPGASWTSLAQYLFDGPTVAARAVLAGDATAGYPALAALLACARAYDLAPPALRAPSLPAHVRLLVEAGDGLPLPAGEAEVSGEGVRVLTVHAAKGLEFPIVLVPNLAKDRFPGRGRSGQAVAAGALQADDAAARAADNRCLFFVALSRARDRLILSRAERYGGRSAAPSPLLALAEPSFAIEPPAYAHWPAIPAPDPAPSVQPETGDAVETASIPVEVEVQGIETYLHCPRRFYYAERLGLRGTDDGQGFPHFQRTLRRALARLHESPPASPAGRGSGQAVRILEEEWAADHVPHPYETLYLERARRIIATAGQALRARSPAVSSSHDAEYLVSRPAGVVRVRIDRVDQAAGESPVAVRYRSGRADDDHRRDHRTALYGAALQAEHGAGSVQQEYLATGAADRAQARASTLDARLRECDDALAGIARGVFPARVGDHCPSCPFWLICPAG